MVLCGSSTNMESLTYTGKYGATNTEYSKTLEYYVVKNVSDKFTPQEDTKMDGQVIKIGQLVVIS